ncbi:hypothetical protein HRbin26_00132 [bacterium HR26]|nr:hypothetical protein HRbin26_00132 [bacterium HR26]
MAAARLIPLHGARLLRRYLAAGVLAFELLWGAAPPQSQGLQRDSPALWLSDPRVDEHGWHAGELILAPGRRLVLTLPDEAPQPAQPWAN